MLLDVIKKQQRKEADLVRSSSALLPSKAAPADKLVQALLTARVSVSQTAMRSCASANGSVILTNR